MNWRKLAVWAGVIAVCVAIVTALVMRSHRWRPRLVTIQGAVIRQDQDSHKELPIANVRVTASDGLITASAKSDASGYFKVQIKESVWPGQKLTLSLRSPEYDPVDLILPMGIRTTTKKLYVARMTLVEPEAQPLTNKKPSEVRNIRIRYTVNSKGEENVGSVVKTFQVVNQGNVPCNRQAPCSPDGSWKASTGSLTLDAGPDNEFRDARASCIAGPCPFTRLDASGFEHGGRRITASALDWSDTATFLLQAEVFRTSITSRVRGSYPVIFGNTLNFTLPPTEEGVSIEADLDGTPMVFPLGPSLYLSWASCSSRTNRESEKSMVYRCELKPGYRF